ncbi:hypothetical protein BKA70DRAFT_318102 [Coprinopsis sp. MPI-PUGE-AT-0042]|nr:hypothetical protein BKA70DRAFT_318102 [Coprinopsis sp. MPI-PUGE-AT-0042]
MTQMNIRSKTSVDLHSLTRNELISLLESEWLKHPCAMPSGYHQSCENIRVAAQRKDTIVESLTGQLREYEVRTKKLEATIQDLREELSNLSRQQSPTQQSPTFSSAALSTLSAPVAHLSPKARSTTPDIIGSSSRYFGGRALYSKDSDASSSSLGSNKSREAPELKDLVTRIQSLNTIIAAAASTFSRSLHYNDHLVTVPDRRALDGINECLVRSTWVVGERVASELVSEPLPVREMMTHGSTYQVPQILAQMVLEMVLAKWAAFVLGWVEAGFVAVEPDAHTEWHRTVRNLRSQLDSENKDTWMASIMSCTKDIAYISGWAFKTCSEDNGKDDPAVALSPFVAAVQGIRKALDHVQSHSYTMVGIHLIVPGTPFNPSPARMTDGYAIGKKTVFGVRRRPSVSENDSVIGNTGLGLKGHEERPMLPPTVVRERAFLDAFSRSAQVEEPKIRVRVGGGRSAGSTHVKSPP